MMGTDNSLDAATNVEVITYMEQEVLKLGKTNGFEGIFTTNTNPLTQVRLEGYTFIKLDKIHFEIVYFLWYVYYFFSNLELTYLDIKYFMIARLIVM